MVALDLRATRRKAGLRQRDCAHLMGVTESRVSQMETGTSPPTAEQALVLSIIYGKPMEVLAAGALDEVVDTLVDRLMTIPSVVRTTSETFNRAYTLSNLAVRLQDLKRRRYGG